MSGQSIGANPMKHNETNTPLPDAMLTAARPIRFAFAHRGGYFSVGAYPAVKTHGGQQG